MSATYLFRLDDISWDMNYENFCRIRDLFFQYDIRPIIGIIPNNNDPNLKAQMGQIHISQEQFWAEMRDLQQNHGWAVALHGYDHVYVTSDGGLLNLNSQSEFAGLPYAVQLNKLLAGKGILEDQGLVISAFMAPSHSYDRNTLLALRACGIDTVTDGNGLFPFVQDGLLFVPQLISSPRTFPFGVQTFCQHTNLMNDASFQRIEAFIKKHSASCGDFTVVMKQNWQKSGPQIANRIFSGPISNLLRALRKKRT